MAERKCDFAPLIEKTDGRATCPDNFFKKYHEQNNCPGCPKARNLESTFFVEEKLSKGAWIARHIIEDDVRYYRSRRQKPRGRK